MAREVVTSENKADYDAKKLGLKKNIKHPIETTIKLKNKDFPVTMHPIEKREGNEIAHVNPETFDKAFKKTEWQYVGKNGDGGIEGRYKKFADWVKDADSMHASNASIDPKGSITFGDGRHRYAYLRDEGLKKIPMSMDEESIENAKKHGYLAS
jgi:hypothetical protein